jgi:hypothetical protein
MIFIALYGMNTNFAEDNRVLLLSYRARFVKLKENERVRNHGLSFVKIPKNRTIEDRGIIYKDVLSYSNQKPFGDEDGRNINVHETVHGIHSDVRNEYEKKLGYRLNALYCLDGNVILLKEPKITIRHVIKYVPEELRSYRWNLYFVQQLSNWDDQPTYILDEWIAYILGSKCAVNDHELGINTHRSDAVSGCLDFSIYSVAFAMAVKEHDPNYWRDYPEFKETIKYHLIQAEKTLGAGLDVSAFNSEKQDSLYNNLLHHINGEDMRKFLLDEFDGIFVD